MFSGILMLVLGLGLIAASVYHFLMHKNYLGIVYGSLALVSLAGGIILLILNIRN